MADELTNAEVSGVPPLPWWKVPSREWLSFLRRREEQVFLVLTLVIGALVGLIVVAFILLTENFGARIYPPGSAAWHRVLAPIVGSLAMGYLLFKYFPDARGSGVPQTKAALYARGGVISFGTVFGKFFCTSATLASGIPLGREGPSVQVGAGLSSLLGRALGLSPEKVKALIPVGAAAAVAAAFNTPLAAVLFALEEVVGDMHAPVLGSVVLASATSWAMLRLLLGNDPLFKVPEYQLVSPWEFFIYALLGVLGGLMSVAFTKLLLWMREKFMRLPRKTAWAQPLAGGVVVGLMGWFVPQTLGVGYSYVGSALNVGMALKLMLLLLVLKFFAVVTSYASGNAGGIFGPALFLGAMLGGSVGTIAHGLFPTHVATAGVYALVGMGTAFAGIVRAPMTSVVMIFETTRDYAVIVPLMISNLVSFFISAKLQPAPIYEELAEQDGIHLPKDDSRTIEGQRRVMRAMRPATEILTCDMTVKAAVEIVKGSSIHAWPVSDKPGIVGVVGRATLEKVLSEGGGDGTLEQFTNEREFPHLHVDQTLSVALDRLGATHLDALPVVSRADIHKLEGMVTLQDVLNLYGFGGSVTKNP
ncbi:MAG: chloride channel protein [Candidatus Acidiferrum sp.]